MIYNTGETSEELKAKYNPEGSVLRNAQYRMLDMLKYLNDVCESLNISWSLEGGNVLGAVRHGGFIPWDDDTDVIIERKDYQKLIKYLIDNPHPQYALQTAETDQNFNNTWIVLRDKNSLYKQNSLRHKKLKYQGLQIDIFPIQRGQIRWVEPIANKLQLINLSLFCGRFPRLARINYLFLNVFLFPIFRFLSARFGDQRYFSYEYGHGHRVNFKYDDVFPTKPLKFENITVPGPNNLDGYLTSLFKNYMNLPPIDKRDKHEADYELW